MSATDKNSFTWIAPVYDFLADAYSLGQITRSKLSQVQSIETGQRVLYAGAGNAVDAIAAAQKGAAVTVVELSPDMLTRARQKAEKAGVAERIDWHCGDVFATDFEEPFDVVVANYFLNVFDEQLMPSLLDRLLQKLASNGRFMIADFAPPVRGHLQRMLQKLYFYSAVAAFRLIAGNAWHPLYDYTQLLKSHGMLIHSVEDFRIGRIGPAWYRSIIAVRIE